MRRKEIEVSGGAGRSVDGMYDINVIHPMSRWLKCYRIERYPLLRRYIP